MCISTLNNWTSVLTISLSLRFSLFLVGRGSSGGLLSIAQYDPYNGP